MAGQIRKLFTDEEIINTLTLSKADGVKYLSDLRGVAPSRQLLSYWQKRFLPENAKRNGDPYQGDTVLNRKLRNDMELRAPSQKDFDAKTPVTNDTQRILVIPDQHAPYHHPDTIRFLTDVKAAIDPTRVINLGDETDGHALSFHDSDPNLDSAGVELGKARIFIKELASVFPQMQVCHSNHGSLIYRNTFKSGIPVEYIKSYRDILFPDGGGDGWSWAEDHRLVLPNGDAVVFRHHFVGAKNQVGHGLRANVCQGHMHGDFSITFDQTSVARNWAMMSGCLIDADAMAFAYGKMYEKKPIIGCTAIIDSQPLLIPMPVDNYGRYTGKLGGVFA